MKVKKILEETNNRGVFNRAYKLYLESKGKIRCAHCKYHNNENYGKKNVYGGRQTSYGFDNVKFPSWKLTTKNKKQWMGKNLIINRESTIRTKSIHGVNGYRTNINYVDTYVEFDW